MGRILPGASLAVTSPEISRCGPRPNQIDYCCTKMGSETPVENRHRTTFSTSYFVHRMFNLHGMACVKAVNKT